MPSPYTKILKDGLLGENPIYRQVLGICSALAVTNLLANTLFMCFGVIFATALTNFTVSLLRNHIPKRIRMIVQVVIIASYVMMIDILIKAVAPDIHRFIGPYVGLIITNCIIMGRAEAVALTSPPKTALIDGLSSGIGYAYVLLIIAAVRELLGTGGIWGVTLLGGGWQNWTIMVMAPGGFFVLALFIWIVKGWIMNPARKAQA